MLLLGQDGVDHGLLALRQYARAGAAFQVIVALRVSVIDRGNCHRGKRSGWPGSLRLIRAGSVGMRRTLCSMLRALRAKAIPLL